MKGGLRRQSVSGSLRSGESSLTQRSSRHASASAGSSGHRLLPRDLAVDIIINNYNYGRFLRQSVESALAQTHAQVKVIAVDDGSTDSSREILHAYEDRIDIVLKERRRPSLGNECWVQFALRATSSSFWILTTSFGHKLPNSRPPRSRPILMWSKSSI